MGGGEHRPMKVLVIGGSYAGLAATITLLDLCRGRTSTGSIPPDGIDSKLKTPVQIKLVDERDGFYHLIGSPLALASQPYSKKAWMPFSSLPALQVPNLKIVQGSATAVNTERKIASIRTATGDLDEPYDYLIAASGLRRVFPVVPQSLTQDSYLVEAGAQIQAIGEAKEAIVVIGGGAVGIEMAAELKLVHPNKSVRLVHSNEKLLSSEPLPDELRDTTLSLVQEAGVEVLLSSRVKDVTEMKNHHGKEYKVVLGDGKGMLASHVIWAISKAVPTTNYLPTSALDSNQLVKINAKMNFTGEIKNKDHHFAIGDLVSWSGIKRCGAAMAMGHNAAFNIHQQLLEAGSGGKHKAEFIEFPEVPSMIALAVGKKAVSYSPNAGTKVGVEVMRNFFGEDLGLKRCYGHLRLGVDPGLGAK